MLDHEGLSSFYSTCFSIRCDAAGVTWQPAELQKHIPSSPPSFFLSSYPPLIRLNSLFSRASRLLKRFLLPSLQKASCFPLIFFAPRNSSYLTPFHLP